MIESPALSSLRGKRSTFSRLQLTLGYRDCSLSFLWEIQIVGSSVFNTKVLHTISATHQDSILVKTIWRSITKLNFKFRFPIHAFCLCKVHKFLKRPCLRTFTDIYIAWANLHSPPHPCHFRISRNAFWEITSMANDDRLWGKRLPLILQLTIVVYITSKVRSIWYSIFSVTKFEGCQTWLFYSNFHALDDNICIISHDT